MNLILPTRSIAQLRSFSVAVAMTLGLGAPLSSAAASGAVDLSFDPGSGNRGGFTSDVEVVADVTALAIQADGKVIAGGVFNHVGSVSRPGLARLNPDGSLDPTFDPGLGLERFIEVVTLDAENRILAGGWFSGYDGADAPYLARVGITGTGDTDFAPRPDDFVNTCLVLPDGRLLVAGYFQGIAGTARSCIARLNPDGSLDETFQPGVISTGRAGDPAGVYSVVLQADGKIVIGGHFSTVGGIARQRIARLNADGSLDTPFDPGLGTNPYDAVYDLELQPDGRILVGGWFETLHGQPRRLLGRLLSDGSLDTAFEPRIDPTFGLILSLLCQPDGKVVVGGQFESVGGVPRNGIARFHPDGSLDLDFDPGTGPQQDTKVTPYPMIRRLALQADGAVLAGGDFIEFDGVRINRLVRLTGDCGGAVAWERSTGVVAESQRQVDIPLIREGSTAGPVSVGVGVLASSTAVEGVDFELASQTVVFGAGEMVQTLTLSVPEGGMTAGDRVVNLSLGNPVGGVLLGATKVVSVAIAGRPGGEILPPQFLNIEHLGTDFLQLTLQTLSPGDYVLQRRDEASQWTDLQTHAGPGTITFNVQRDPLERAVLYRVRR